MSILSRAKLHLKALKTKDGRFVWLAKRGFYKNMDDEEYLKRMFRIFMDGELDFENPKTFSEKIQWLKVYNKDPELGKKVDKNQAKKIVADLIGEEYVIPTLNVWDSPEDIDFDVLPKQFVLKCTHDSGGLVICKDKDKLDRQKAIKKLKKSLKRDYSSFSREWPYSMAQRKIIAEKYMEDSSGKGLNDYKFYCFNGEPKMLLVVSGRGEHDTRFDHYDMDFNRMDIKKRYKQSDEKIEKPVTFEKMKEFAKLLSKDDAFVRIDFYEIDGKLYFGEYTFFPASGWAKFDPEEYDIEMGSWLKLPEKK